MKIDYDEVVSKLDIVKMFYGQESQLYRAFYDHLRWSHKKFLLFIKTCSKLSEFNLTTTHAYSSGDMMDGVMEKDEFIACFDEIHSASSI